MLYFVILSEKAEVSCIFALKYILIKIQIRDTLSVFRLKYKKTKYKIQRHLEILVNFPMKDTLLKNVGKMVYLCV